MAEDLQQIDFTIEDEVDGKPLTPDNVSLPTLRKFLGEVEMFVKGDQLGLTLAESKVRVHEGSLKIQMLVGPAVAFSIHSDLQKLRDTGDLDLIQQRRAHTIQQWQRGAEKSPARKYLIGDAELSIEVSSRSDFAHGNEKAWVNVEKYFTGKIYNAGGKQEPNIHIQLENGDTLRIDATEHQLGAAKENPLFKTMTLRVRAEQHLRTKALRNLRLVDFVPHSGEVDEQALAELWKKGREAWKDIDSPSAWVESLRGNS
jgi:hypothetical protein